LGFSDHGLSGLYHINYRLGTWRKLSNIDQVLLHARTGLASRNWTCPQK
jgi:hypothetical protein